MKIKKLGRKKMRLIDANKVQLKLLEECQNIRYFDKDRKKSQIFADGLDFAWVMLDNQPTVKAIPIEWIKKWCNEEHNRKSLEERLLKRYGVITMLEDWEKENETN